VNESRDRFGAIHRQLALTRSVGDDQALEGFYVGVVAAIAWSKGEQPSAGCLRLTPVMSGVGECFEYFERQTCEDCKAALRHANSDATTPGFFHTECPKHRTEAPNANPR
jgi:hypothetical protein